ncbi:hypothetical protein [Streptomyces sp. SID13031]|uniref:hypothetical protein n=1 Tax=Streptomyces sp. SID13031 TaxID=2706046 RepID=UPI0013CA0AB3|nr:hypothetical protein [Streptomyces sp. SID13031]NEA37448.1 hypothetical protein [Streptomyces sp. SID13031]
MTVEAFWDSSDDELFARLGAGLLGEGLGISPDEQESHRRFGMTWFANKRRDLQQIVCHAEVMQGLLGTSRSDRIIDAAAVYELLQENGHDPVNAAVLAVLIARVGLGAFCATAPPKS